MSPKTLVRTAPPILALGAVGTAFSLFIDGFQQGEWIPVLRVPPVRTIEGWTTIGLVLLFLVTTWLLVRLDRKPRPLKLGEVLVVTNQLTLERLEHALAQFRDQQGRFGEFLVAHGLVVMSDIEAAIAVQRRMELLIQRA